jgi:hypothetical protein
MKPDVALAQDGSVPFTLAIQFSSCKLHYSTATMEHPYDSEREARYPLPQQTWSEDRNPISNHNNNGPRGTLEGYKQSVNGPQAPFVEHKQSAQRPSLLDRVDGCSRLLHRLTKDMSE